MRFQYDCKNNLSSNQLTIVILEKIPVEKEPEVPINHEIPEEQVTLDKGFITVSMSCCVLISRSVLT